MLISFLTTALAASTLAVPSPDHTFGHEQTLTVGFPLRLLCIGDSITVGVGDHLDKDGYNVLDGKNNGYRLDLYNKLVGAGFSPQFIGTQLSGTTDNPQPDMEGYAGQTIETILSAVRADLILEQGPNVVLIHAGTNDNDYPQYPDTDNATSFANAPHRLGILIDYVLCYDPQAVVLVAELVQNKYNPSQTDAFNAAIPGIVGERYLKGYKVRGIDMRMVEGRLIGDLLHPTVAGYAVMAEQWYQAIQGVPAQWWSPPQPVLTIGKITMDICARGSISFAPTGIVAMGWHAETGNAANTTLLLADMDGDGLDDHVTLTDDSQITIDLNGGRHGSAWYWKSQLGSHPMALPRNVDSTQQAVLADLNADGRDDYIIADDKGVFTSYFNLGPQLTGDEWEWFDAGTVNLTGGAVGTSRFADFNGDGRADFIFLSSEGYIKVWLNDGPTENIMNWTSIVNGGAVALDVGAAAEDIHFADIDGDGKADYVWLVPECGSMRVWYNRFDGKTVGWVEGGTVLHGQGYPGRNVHLARIAGSGRYDYVAVQQNTGVVELWSNQCEKTNGIASRPVAEQCGLAPMPTQTTIESAPVRTNIAATGTASTNETQAGYNRSILQTYAKIGVSTSALWTNTTGMTPLSSSPELGSHVTTAIEQTSTAVPSYSSTV